LNGGALNTAATITLASGGTLNIGGATVSGSTGGTIGGSGTDIANGGAIHFNQTDAVTMGRSISGVGTLTQAGSGTSILSVTNSYTGATNVTGGKLIVNGNISTSSLTTISSGATLGGSGTVGKTVINGTLAPGNSPGQMTYTDTLGLIGSVIMEIDGTAGAGITGGHDFVNLTGGGAAGMLTYGGSMTLDMGMTFGAGTYSWNLFDMASTAGTFTSVTLSDQYSGSLLDADLNGVWDLTSGANTWQFTESTGVLGLTVIPEPNTAALLGGFGVLALLCRRRN
jgi:fibronectin-binding autotransporter adhesin